MPLNRLADCLNKIDFSSSEDDLSAEKIKMRKASLEYPLADVTLSTVLTL